MEESYEAENYKAQHGQRVCAVNEESSHNRALEEAGMLPVERAVVGESRGAHVRFPGNGSDGRQVPRSPRTSRFQDSDESETCRTGI